MAAQGTKPTAGEEVSVTTPVAAAASVSEEKAVVKEETAVAATATAAPTTNTATVTTTAATAIDSVTAPSFDETAGFRNTASIFGELTFGAKSDSHEIDRGPAGGSVFGGYDADGSHPTGGFF